MTNGAHFCKLGKRQASGRHRGAGTQCALRKTGRSSGAEADVLNGLFVHLGARPPEHDTCVFAQCQDRSEPSGWGGQGCLPSVTASPGPFHSSTLRGVCPLGGRTLAAVGVPDATTRPVQCRSV